MEARDIDLLIAYWYNSSPEFLTGMGVDLAKMPKEDDWRKMLEMQLSLPITEKRSYCLIWEKDGKAIGHCNTNPTEYGKEAYMHLHMWDNDQRQKGMGAALVKESVARFFKDLQLERLYCQPYAMNDAPNRTLEKAGFRFVKEYVTTPGFINFEQPVKLWVMEKEDVVA